MGLISSIKYGLILAKPKDFYNENHRASHFIKFNKTELNEEYDENDKTDVF